MNKIIIVCGLIAGLIVSSIMLISMAMCAEDMHFEYGMLIGYGSMILAFSLIFVGIKNYRDKYNHGLIGFGKAFTIGLFISLIASTMYVIVWEIDFAYFIPDFMDKYTAHMLKEAKASGVSSAEIIKKTKEMADMAEMYKSPLFRIPMTYVEILPVGLLISVISSFILKRK